MSHLISINNELKFRILNTVLQRGALTVEISVDLANAAHTPLNIAAAFMSYQVISATTGTTGTTGTTAYIIPPTSTSTQSTLATTRGTGPTEFGTSSSTSSFGSTTNTVVSSSSYLGTSFEWTTSTSSSGNTDNVGPGNIGNFTEISNDNVTNFSY
jgi:hypothetical protein